MSDSNRMTYWVFVVLLVAVAIVVLIPPSEKLKGGIDLVGGTSLLFEIDTTGLPSGAQSELSSKMIRILRERVDPKGQLNLEWRPVGNTRLEVRLPRPPEAAAVRRETYNKTKEAVRALGLVRYEVEEAIQASGTQREEKIAALAKDIPQRKEALATLVKAADALADATEDTKETKSAAYEDAMSAVLATSLEPERMEDVFTLGKGTKSRNEQLEKLEKEFPEYATRGLIAKAMEAYDAWAKQKADLEDAADLKRALRGAGVLEFRILATRDVAQETHTSDPRNPLFKEKIEKYTSQLAQYGPRPQAGDSYAWFEIDDVVSFMRLDNIEEFEAQKDLPGRPIMEKYAGRYYVLTYDDPAYMMLRNLGKKRWGLTHVYSSIDPMSGQNVVNFELDPRGGKYFRQLTGANIERQLCIMLDNKAMSHATIRDEIGQRCQISGDFSPEKVRNLVNILDAGSLPARLKETPLAEKTIGPSLGKTNRVKGITAAVIGVVIVALFVLVYYGIIAGGMADIALALNLLFVLSAMALMQATFTLPGIAGLILTIGMAIDANVLIFERIREERDRGIILKKALNTGYDKAFSTIFDANITTLITCAILGFVGSEEVKGFAITLGIGITTSMFTSLFVTRLAFTTMIAKGLLSDLKMMRMLQKPSIEWMTLRSTFWPISLICVVCGLFLFFGQAIADKEAVFDIEFLGGTSVQIDLKPGVAMSDEETRHMVGDANTEGSAVAWLRQSAEKLEKADIQLGESNQVLAKAEGLTGEQLATLLRVVVEDKVTANGVHVAGRTVALDPKPNELNDTKLTALLPEAAKIIKLAADNMANARVQEVKELEAAVDKGLSYEIVTIEQNRALVQEAILAAFGDRLIVQRPVTFTTRIDDEITSEPYFVVENDDHYLSDVIGGRSTRDIRRFRGGVVVVVDLDEAESPMTTKALDERLRNMAKQPGFQTSQTADSEVYGLGTSVQVDGADGYKSFAVVAVNPKLRYEDDPQQWEDSLAFHHHRTIEAALSADKSLSHVVQFDKSVSQQTTNRAVAAIILALAAIVAYLWLRFGTKEFGLAAIVALVHDVSITLGLVALSHYVAGVVPTIHDFKIDLPMIAALLTVIGYSLNDTIVVFDRIRENRGRLGSLTHSLINNSINQTLSRTVLTSLTTFIVVAVLYFAGGKGVHGFSFALMIGVVVGTYSSLGVATPLLYRPAALLRVVTILLAATAIGIVFLVASDMTWRLVMIGIVVAAAAYIMATRIKPDVKTA